MMRPNTLVNGTLDEFMYVHTGQANKDGPHLIVPFYMPLAPPLSFKEGLQCLSPRLREQVRSGRISLLAIAHGQMVEPETAGNQVQFVLLREREDGQDHHLLFDTIEGDLETAVLMEGDGTRYLNQRPLAKEEAVALWIGGFLGWNDKVPGLYRLRYALIADCPKE
jgi:hypothetical protein